jgi:type IV pilus assembly protein PilM
MPIAIDIGTRALHLVQGQSGKSTVNIRQAVIEPLPSGLVQDGIIREFGGLEMALKAALARNRIRDRSCAITIHGSHIYNRELDVPDVKKKVLDDIVSFEVQSFMSVNKEVAVEYTVSKQRPADKPDHLRVRASAIQVDYVNDYHKLLRNCGLSPLALDIHPNALSKVIAGTEINDKPQAENANVMFLDLGAVTATAYIFNNGEIAYSRIIPTGGLEIERYVNSVNNSLNGEASSADWIQIDKLDLSPANLRDNIPLSDAVRPMVATLRDGVQRIQQFLSGRQGGRVDKIYLYGRTALFSNLESMLEDAFGVETELIRKIGRVTMPQDIPIAPFVNAIGAMIRLD